MFPHTVIRSTDGLVTGAEPLVGNQGVAAGGDGSWRGMDHGFL